MVTGTGSGEWVAACVAGILDLEDAIKLCVTGGDVASADLARPQMGAGPHNMDYPPKLGLITSDCGTTCSLSIKYP